MARLGRSAAGVACAGGLVVASACGSAVVPAGRQAAVNGHVPRVSSAALRALLDGHPSLSVTPVTASPVLRATIPERVAFEGVLFTPPAGWTTARPGCGWPDSPPHGEWLLRAAREVEVGDMIERHERVEAIVTRHGGFYDGGESSMSAVSASIGHAEHTGPRPSMRTVGTPLVSCRKSSVSGLLRRPMSVIVRVGCCTPLLSAAVLAWRSHAPGSAHSHTRASALCSGARSATTGAASTSPGRSIAP